jgi:cation diffusion facilitator CzcD-associated flavoprotein CzcO
MLKQEQTSVVIVGAGPAGLAVAACLKQQSVPFVLLERQHAVGSSWRAHYDRLHLHTDKAHSSLPLFPLPKELPRYPSRQQVVDYLDQYAAHFQLTPRFGQDVRKAHHQGQWHVETQDTALTAPVLVVAAGVNREPNRPDWPGLSGYQGQVIHSAEYKNGAAFKGKRVLVVGLGNSGGEIVVDLWEHGAQPSVCVRSPVNVIPKEIFGVPFLTIGILQQHLPPRLADALNAPIAHMLMGDLTRYGLRKPKLGPIAQINQEGKVPFIDVGTIKLIRQGKAWVRPDIQRFTPHGVVFTDGRQESIDAVVLATGFKARVDRWLDAPNAPLNSDGCPAASGCQLDPPGLYFCGFRISPTGMLREIGLEAQRIGPDISRYLAKRTASNPHFPEAPEDSMRNAI